MARQPRDRPSPANKSRVLLNDAAAARVLVLRLLRRLDEARKSASRSSCSRMPRPGDTPQQRSAGERLLSAGRARARARRHAQLLAPRFGASAAPRSATPAAPRGCAARRGGPGGAARAARRTHPYQFRSPAVRGPLHVLPACRARALSGRPFFFCAVFTALLQRLCYGACIALNPSGVYKCGFYNCDRHHRAVLLHVCATAA